MGSGAGGQRWFIGRVAGRHCFVTSATAPGEKLWQLTRGRVFLRACPVSLPCSKGGGLAGGGISAFAVGRLGFRALATLTWHADCLTI